MACEMSQKSDKDKFSDALDDTLCDLDFAPVAYMKIEYANKRGHYQVVLCGYQSDNDEICFIKLSQITEPDLQMITDILEVDFQIRKSIENYM